MTRKAKLLSALGLSLAVLVACDGSDGVVGNAQAQFGSLFAAAFNADANADPKDDPDLAIVYNGVQDVDLTADPLDI
jgi:phosphoglycolate phosphatase-like HAD superfamily hydrolase